MSERSVEVESNDQSIELKLFRKSERKEKMINFLPLGGLLCVIVFFSIITKGQFFSSDNIISLLNQSFILLIVIIGGTFLYAIGGLDMAVGAVMALSAMAITFIYQAGYPLIIAFLAGMIISIVCMGITAIAKCYLSVPSFIGSLCVMTVSQGIVLYIVSNYGRGTFSINDFRWLDYTYTKVFVLIILITIGYILFSYTSFGKSLRAIGGNPSVARISGIRINKTTILAYVVMGIVLTIGALFTLSRNGIADNTVGSGLNLNVVTAIVLGGFPLEGGAKAKFRGPIIGALIVTCLTNGLGLLGQANSLGFAVKGLLFIIVIALTYDKSKGKLIY